MPYLAAAYCANSGLAPTPGVFQTTGVEPNNNVVDLTDADDNDDEDLSSEVVHKVENVPGSKNDQPEDYKEQAEEHNRGYSLGMRIRKRIESYVPSMEGKS